MALVALSFVFLWFFYVLFNTCLSGQFSLFIPPDSIRKPPGSIGISFRMFLEVKNKEHWSEVG